jgi:hypothetical protein
LNFPTRQIVLALVGILILSPAILIPVKFAKSYPEHFNNPARLRAAWNAAADEQRLAVIVLVVRYLGWFAIGSSFILDSIGWSGYLLRLLGLGLVVGSVLIRTGWWVGQKLH